MRHEDSVGYKMRLIHNRIHKQMEAKRIENEGDITGMQRWTLGYLNDHADTEIYQKDIEQEFKVSRATASNMLQLMERKGLIVRESVSCDARLKKISLTEKAKNMVAKSDADIREMEQLITKGFHKEETEQLKHYLDRIMENIGVAEDCCGRKCKSGAKGSELRGSRYNEFVVLYKKMFIEKKSFTFEYYYSATQNTMK